ncbi:hypothetical protein CASFOL_000618 [Castilleja foliolosa]|uniref:Uncharacterized protein n=1 Tax=Castilleja foliolosa TaxID=1961234 RepID=A0ABD3EM41_9LAMI
MQMGIQSSLSEMETRQEMAAIFKRFGDEQSALFDQYERLSFEVQLNKAMLGRSLSEPAVASRYPPAVKPEKQGWRRGRGSGFHKVMKKLLSQILGHKGPGPTGKDGGPSDRKDPIFLKAFSRSVRV